jgi:hypothetical protein
MTEMSLTTVLTVTATVVAFVGYLIFLVAYIRLDGRLFEGRFLPRTTPPPRSHPADPFESHSFI